MPLVRCSCVSRLVPSAGGVRLDVALVDPDCGYVVHRIGATPCAPEVTDAIDG